MNADPPDRSTSNDRTCEWAPLGGTDRSTSNARPRHRPPNIQRPNPDTAGKWSGGRHAHRSKRDNAAPRSLHNCTPHYRISRGRLQDWVHTSPRLGRTRPHVARVRPRIRSRPVRFPIPTEVEHTLPGVDQTLLNVGRRCPALRRSWPAQTPSSTRAKIGGLGHSSANQGLSLQPRSLPVARLVGISPALPTRTKPATMSTMVAM